MSTLRTEPCYNQKCNKILSYLSPSSLEDMELKFSYFSTARTQARKTKTHLDVIILHCYYWAARMYCVDIQMKNSTQTTNLGYHQTYNYNANLAKDFTGNHNSLVGEYPV